MKRSQAVSQMMTGFGPMVYDSQVYIPITIELDYAGPAVRLAILYTRIRTMAAGTMSLQLQTSYI